MGSNHHNFARQRNPINSEAIPNLLPMSRSNCKPESPTGIDRLSPKGSLGAPNACR
jgi:hypothetical protein